MSFKVLVLGDFQWDFTKGEYIARPTGISVLADIFARGLEQLGCEVTRQNLWTSYASGSYDVALTVSWWGDAINLVHTPHYYGFKKVFPMVITDGYVPKQYADILSNATKVLATSKYTKDIMIRDGIPENKIELVLQAIDTELFRPQYDDMVDSLKYAYNKITIFWHFWHGGDMEIVEVIDPIVEQFDNVQFIGKIQYALTKEHIKEFKSKIKHSDKVKLVDLQVPYERLPALYNSCDIFLSLGGSMGGDLPILEAMACGKPVIALNRSSAKEFIIHTVNGCLVEIGKSEKRTDIKAGIPIEEQYDYPDVKDLYVNLSELINDIDYRNSLSKKARETVVKSFNIKDRSKYLLEIMQ